MKLLIFQFDYLLKFWDCSSAKICKSRRAWKMLSNAYFLAKFHFDTAENEPAINLPILLTLTYYAGRTSRRRARTTRTGTGRRSGPRGPAPPTRSSRPSHRCSPSGPRCTRPSSRSGTRASRCMRWAENKGYEYQWYPIPVFGLVLGCIEANFLQVNTRWKALDEIYKIYNLF